MDSKLREVSEITSNSSKIKSRCDESMPIHQINLSSNHQNDTNHLHPLKTAHIIGSTVSVSTCPTCGSENVQEKIIPSSCVCDIKRHYKIPNLSTKLSRDKCYCRSSKCVHNCHSSIVRENRFNSFTRFKRKRRSFNNNLKELNFNNINNRDICDFDLKECSSKRDTQNVKNISRDIRDVDNGERCYCAKCPKCIRSFRKETLEYGLSRWDIEGWHERRKRETMKKRERALVMIVSIVAIIIFIVMSYFGTILFLRMTKVSSN